MVTNSQSKTTLATQLRNFIKLDIVFNFTNYGKKNKFETHLLDWHLKTKYQSLMFLNILLSLLCSLTVLLPIFLGKEDPALKFRIAICLERIIFVIIIFNLRNRRTWINYLIVKEQIINLLFPIIR